MKRQAFYNDHPIYEDLDDLLWEMKTNLSKAMAGNKAAAQRFRVGSVHFSKMSKIFRSLSVQWEKEADQRKKKRSFK